MCINRDRYDAVPFDLDGVITDTASIHAACWKAMFDAYLQKWSCRKDQPFLAFDVCHRLETYVDGKPTGGVEAYPGSIAFIELREEWALKQP